MERYACQFSPTIVAFGAIGFVAEVFNALEYIKGNHIINIISSQTYTYLFESILYVSNRSPGRNQIGHSVYRNFLNANKVVLLASTMEKCNEIFY